MNQYIYRGENEKDFFLAFVHNVCCDYLKEPTDDSVVDLPYVMRMAPR